MELRDIDLKELIERETGQKFNKENKICCPFHKESTPSFSVRFDSNANKDKFKCFGGCGETGDAVDFIRKIRNIGYIEAKEYLGLSTEKSIGEQLEDKVKSYIQWQINNTDFRKGNKLLGIFQFVDDKNNTMYFKTKFLKSDGKKDLSYYHIENDKVINKRGTDELIYNYYSILEGIKDGKIIIICEGEKDANTLNRVLKNDKYVATSIKGCKNLSPLEDAKIYVCSDTGEAGEKYKWHIYNELFHKSKVFKFINLPGLKELGDNKDCTDWLESGRTKKDLLEAFDKSLDLKNKHELQQDKGGIYRTIFKEKSDEIKETKKYLTNFQIIKAISIKYVDRDSQGIKLLCKTPTGKTFEKMKEVSVFDDVKSFRNFLGAMDLSYKGDLNELIILKEWINKYFIYDHVSLYDNPRFIFINKDMCLITNDGMLYPKKINENFKSESNFRLDIINCQSINKDELQELMQYLFEFTTKPRSYSIIGTIINYLAVVQATLLKIKFHHLLIVGESGSGKTTIMTNVVAPILNYPIGDIKSIGLITPFALIKVLSDGNYPILFDEFKPSSLDHYKIAKLSETLRNLYDRAIISRGDKSFNINNFQLTRPIIIAGEESYPNQEKALIERSCIVYLSKFERTEEQTKAMKYLLKHEILLNKLGRSLVNEVLNLTTEEYSAIRENIEKQIKNLNDRPLNTAINICTGIEILNKVLSKLGLAKINNYVNEVVSNISTEVLEDGEETYSIVEQILMLYNDMIEDGRAFGVDNVIQCKGDGLYIRTSEMLNQIRIHIKSTNLNMNILTDKDFKTQAKKSGYLIAKSGKSITIDKKTIRFDIYNAKKLKKLGLNSIVPLDFIDAAWEFGEQNIVYGRFNEKR